MPKNPPIDDHAAWEKHIREINKQARIRKAQEQAERFRRELAAEKQRLRALGYNV